MANWSVILNVLLLVGVIFSIVRMVQAKRAIASSKRNFRAESPRTPPAQESDDIISVRRIEPEEAAALPPSEFDSANQVEVKLEVEPEEADGAADTKAASMPPASVMVFLLAKDERQLAGYELLQTILAAGLRFGDGQLFHRHQMLNGQGPIVCSLATATADGTFDLQNMGALSVRGLCMFMEASGSASIDKERLSIMLATAKQLSEGLDTHLLDDMRKPWSEESLQRCYQVLGIVSEEVPDSAPESVLS